MKKSLTILFVFAAFVSICLCAAYLYFDQEKISLNHEVRATLPGSFIKLPNGYVHYELDGPSDGKTVVLVHGFVTPSFLWQAVFDSLTNTGLQVLRYDLYGRGTSSRPDVEYTVDLFQQQLADILIALNITNPVDLVGLSMGGFIVASFANKHPEKVASLTLIAPLIFPPPLKKVFPFNVPLVGEYIATVYYVPSARERGKSDFLSLGSYEEYANKFQEQLQYKGFRRAILSTARNLLNAHVLEQYQLLSNKNIKIQLLWSEDDQSISAEDIQKLRNVIPNMAFHIVENAGHNSPYERPDIVSRFLIDFLNKETN